VRGPHGLGKTALAAITILWFALTREAQGADWKCPTTASAWRQLTKYLWPEIHKWAKRLRWERIGFRGAFNETRELLSLSLKLSFGEAFAVASDNPELIEGAHADSILYVFDESKAIPAATFDAAEGAFSNAGADTANEAFALSISTPGEPVGRFYDIQKRKAGYEDWNVRAVTLEETIAAGRVSREWADQRKVQWGDQSATYLNRVRGEFASSDEDGVIPLSWIEAANQRWLDKTDAISEGRETLPPMDALGVDVGTTGDKTVFAPKHENFIASLRYQPKPPPETATMDIAGKVAGVLRANPLCRAVIDAIGIGAGVVHRLREEDWKVQGFVASEAAVNEGKPMLDQSGELGFANKRAAAWWITRELLDPSNNHNICLPPDDILTGDLTAPKYRTQSGGRILIQSKEEIREKIGRSTDAGDAVVQAFFPEEKAPPSKTNAFDILNAVGSINRKR
jgi:hypothetical protein